MDTCVSMEQKKVSVHAALRTREGLLFLKSQERKRKSAACVTARAGIIPKCYNKTMNTNGLIYLLFALLIFSTPILFKEEKRKKTERGWKKHNGSIRNKTYYWYRIVLSRSRNSQGIRSNRAWK